MDKKRGEKKEKSKISLIMINHVKHHQKNYMIAVSLFLIGLIIGIMFINYTSESNVVQISEYIKKITNYMREVETLDFSSILKNSIASNIVLIIILWISASTIIGIPVVYGTVLFRGFTLGYTISSIILTLGTGNGILFSVTSLLLHNIIFIPVLLATSVSGMNLYQSIIKNRRRENIKIEFIRHTAFCIVMLLILGISSLIETYISTNLAKFVMNYIKI